MGKGAEPDIEVAPRPARESLEELGAFVALVTLPIAFLVLWLSSGADWMSFWELTVQAGTAVLGQIGWVFGVYVPTLLGFYVLVLGEQLGHAAHAGRLRRLLGGVAEVSFAALVPALLLVLLSCVSDPANIGPAFVIVPATFLLLFLTVQLGAFVVSELTVQLDDAAKTQQQARGRLRALSRRSRRPVWLVLTVTVVGVALLGCLAMTGAGGWEWLTQWLACALVGAGALFVCTLASLGAALIAIGTRLGQAGALIGIVLMWLVVWGVAWDLGATPLGPLVVAFVVMAVVATFSAVWPRTLSPRGIIDWTLAGSFARLVAMREVRAYRASIRKIAELRTRIGAGKRAPLGERLSAALTAFRA